VPVLEESAWLVAVTVIVLPLEGIGSGAVNSPEFDIVPELTDQFTDEL
jgi:hypothetical protein